MSIDWGPIIQGAVQTGGQIYQQKVAQRAERKAQLRESIMFQKMMSGDQTHDSAGDRTPPALLKRLGQSSTIAGVGGAGSCGAYGDVALLDFGLVFLALGVVLYAVREITERCGKK
jgi:hypothetical protein